MSHYRDCTYEMISIEIGTIITFTWRFYLQKLSIKKLKSWGGSPGLVVMGGDSRSKGRGFESRCRILDGHDIFSH